MRDGQALAYVYFEEEPGTALIGSDRQSAGLPPGRLGQDEIGPAFGQRSSHLGPHEDGEWPGRDQEVVAGGIPIATVIGHAGTGDEAMDMRMVDELLRPSVQHRHHADGAADVAPITGQLDDGLRGRFVLSERVSAAPSNDCRSRE